MSERPTVDVAVVTWPVSPARLGYFRKLIESMQNLLTASRHEMRFVVSVGREHDPNRTWCGPELEKYLEEIGMDYHWRTRPTETLGYSMNETVGLCTSPYVLLVQDDSVLECPLDLSDGIDLMESVPDIDIVRYGWSIHPSLTISTKPYRDGWEQVILGGRYPYSDNAHLRRSSFAEKFGTYSESRTHGDSERTMIDNIRRHKAFILTAGNHPPFRSRGGEPAEFRSPSRMKLLARLRKEQQ